ncbi:MAG: PEP-utilizing enzyme [Thermodesulfovibrio sp.]|nr:PEP-utilizing enzyme [Thermodesulfovibrio sp.]
MSILIKEKDIEERLSTTAKIFLSYPGIFNTVQDLIDKLKNSLTPSLIQQLENHYLKYYSYYFKHSEGAEATQAVFNFLIKKIEEETFPEECLRATLRILLKLIEEDTLSDYSYRSIIYQVLSKIGDLDLQRFLTNLSILRLIGKTLLKTKTSDVELTELFVGCYKKYLKYLYLYYSSIEDKNLGLPQLAKFEIEKLIAEFKDFYKKTSEYSDINELLLLPSETEILNKFKDLLKNFQSLGKTSDDLLLKIYYLLWILEVNELKNIYDFSLREIGKLCRDFISINSNITEVESLLNDVFLKFNRFFHIHPEAVMFAVEQIGNSIYLTDNKTLLSLFIERTVDLGFHTPEFKGFYEDYTININRYHVRNLKTWFDLICKNPSAFRDLISALSIYLFFGGVHIKDTDFFQKEITKLLNSEISSVFYLIKPLLKRFPVYFNDINAEGQLRTVSTQVDEIIKRKDPLMHFIRKQIHVESSPLLIDLLKETIKFWLTKNPQGLSKYIPEEVIRESNLISTHIEELNKVFVKLSEEFYSFDELVSTPVEIILSKISNLNVSEEIKTKAILTIRLYQLLNAKYRVDYIELETFLKEAFYLGLPDASYLIEVLNNESFYRKAEALVNYLDSLKKIILSPEKYEAFEDITHKRHIVAGIPSVSGKYSERKFNALSVFLRLENTLNSILDQIEDSIDLSFITRATLFRIEKYLKLFYKVLELSGISSQKFLNTLSMLSVALEIRRFTFSQYMDIFITLAESVSDIVNTYCTAPYKKLLKRVINRILKDNESSNEFEIINSLSEKFLRDIVTQYPGLSQLDRLIGRIIKTAYNQTEKLEYKDLDLLMTYDPKKALCDINNPIKELNDRIHLGNKGHNLLILSHLKIPVPPGFILTTEVFRCRYVINKFEPVREHLKKEIRSTIKRLEGATNKLFGNPENPLLVSVRSGGAISMPGMMSSFLNVGINEEIIKGLINQTGKHWFAWDSYRRFLQCWGMSFGIDRDEFDNIINDFKKKYKVELKIQFTPSQMKEVALAYKDHILSKNIEIEEDPWRQLEVAIMQVFNSWYSEKAKAYREILGISEDWGTAVIVQKMVFGNLDLNSGSGVVFTTNPKEPTDEILLWGDFTPATQGEDIVSGLVKTYPISIKQKIQEGRVDVVSLEEEYPEIYETLRKIAQKLIYEEGWDHQEIEFTFEGRGKNNLYILQTREMSYIKGESIYVFTPSEELNNSKVGIGIGVCGGALSGRIVFDINDIRELKAENPHEPVILVRADTVPDDIVHIANADGILTARGGSTSHASIVATKLIKTCVVGFSKMIVYQNEKKCKIGKKTLKKGDYISIDGRSGLVYLGKHPVQLIHISQEYI